jgi:predicted 3-demethylubiquinone-9 3-methyltransferase (glyoxalase superfamily)
MKITINEARKVTPAKWRAVEAIARWKRAYEASNNKPAPTLAYSRSGWVKDRKGNSWRVSAIERMAETLERRSGIEPPTADDAEGGAV